jgi:uncharacterized protein (TIGR02452 family)
MSNNSLVCLPCLDSLEMGLARQRDLDIPRHIARALGESTVKAVTLGGYLVAGKGSQVDWSVLVRNAYNKKESISPQTGLPDFKVNDFLETRLQVTNETTLSATKRFVDEGLNPLVLNLANGVTPGGGFLHGARAQEESLCRSSALYHTLLGDAMYEAHRKRPLPDSTDWAIYSPEVPVFRTDDGITIEQPWLMNVLTCAAPYAWTVGRLESAELLRLRINRVLSIARAYGYFSLVLGAWGCGAFGNDAELTAQHFRTALEGEFKGVFSDIVFAITDWSPERKFLGPFSDVFRN